MNAGEINEDVQPLE
jgi:hypothetical protein